MQLRLAQSIHPIDPSLSDGHRFGEGQCLKSKYCAFNQDENSGYSKTMDLLQEMNKGGPTNETVIEK